MRRSNHHRPWWARVAMVSALALVACPARADDAEEAQLQFDIGRELYEQGRSYEALEHLLSSHRLVANHHVAQDIAEIYTLLHRPTEAYNWYETFLSESTDPTERAAATAARDALAPGLAIVEVVTSPPGAVVYVDRVELGSIGRAPRRIALAAGARTILARADHHDEASGPVDARVGEVARIELTLVRHTGHLTITSEPPGATVALEASEALLGVTPLALDLPSGELHLLFSRDGYVDQSRTVSLERGQARALDVRMAREASTVAVLTVTGAPEGAEVRLDGALIGSVPLTRADVSPGRAHLEIRGADVAPFATDLVLEAGGATRVVVELLPATTFAWETERWIVWGAAFALAVAGATLGGLAIDAQRSFFAAPDAAVLSQRERLAIASDVLLSTALVAVVIGVVGELLAVPPRQSHADVAIER